MAKKIYEIHRNLETVELLEQLQLDFNITGEEYRSTHDVSGKIRAQVVPDNKTKRAREKPPKSILGRISSSTSNVDSLALETGYPQTAIFAAVSRQPPTTQSGEAHQEGLREQRFSVEDLPENGTVKLESSWSVHQIKQALENDEHAFVEHEYDIVNFPSDQLPIVLRAELERDAREYLEDQMRMTNTRVTSRYEGQAILAIEIEFPQNAPEAERAGGYGKLEITNFSLDMESTFNDISFLDGHQEANNYTYNPEKKRVEWRGGQISKGQTLRYIIAGPLKELLDLGLLRGQLRGRVKHESLSGTSIKGLYDQTGSQFWSSKQRQENAVVDVSHQIRIKGKMEIDPDALSGEVREVTKGTITVNDRPSEAFDRVETVCRREDMKIRSTQSPANPEPAPNREGVFQITGEENREGDDQPGQLEVKSEYGNEGVVYAEIEVTGEFTSMTEQSEVSAFDDSQDRLVRSDQGGLETRGKSEVEIRARSASSELNSDLISKIKEGLTGVGGGQTNRPSSQPNQSLEDTQQGQENRALESEPSDFANDRNEGDHR